MALRRYSADELAELYHLPLHPLGQLANSVRYHHNPGRRVTFVVNHNVNYTNVCDVHCRFCAFYRPPKHEEAYVLPYAAIREKAEALTAIGGTQILLQGGVNRALRLDYFVTLLGRLKADFPHLHLHALSPSEIQALAQEERLTVYQVLCALKEAGMSSLPGAGAEMLVERLRQKISPLKVTSEQWLEVMRQAHRAGLPSSATLVFGVGETLGERIEHLIKLRDLQDETGGFVAFIAWTMQFPGTRMERDGLVEAGGEAYLRMVALSRLALDNFAHLQASCLTQTPQVGQLALSFGCDDLGDVMLEENVVRVAADARPSIERMVQLIENAGFDAVQRDTYYAPVRVFARPNVGLPLRLC